MPGPPGAQNLQMPHPRDWQGGQMHRSSRGGWGGGGGLGTAGIDWCIICRKLSAFDRQLNLIVVLIYLKTCVKDRGDSSAPIARKKDLISTYQGALVSGFVNISVYFTKLANNFKPNDRFFKRIQILLVIQTEN